MPALLLGAALLAATAGCHNDERTFVAYEPQLRMSDLAAGVSGRENAFEILQNGSTIGRFPCGIAVARLAPTSAGVGLAADSDGAAVEAAIEPVMATVEVLSNEQSRWAEAFRGCAEVRELVFLAPVTMKGRDGGIGGLCSAARRMGASLLLVYSANRYGPNSAQRLGILYDAVREQPIATLHASATFLDEPDDDDEEPREVSPDEMRGDHRDWDAVYQAARAFEAHALAAVRELIELDNALPSTQPHRWQADPQGRWWVPRVIKEK